MDCGVVVTNVSSEMMSQSSYSVTPDTRHNRFSSKINLQVYLNV